VARRGNRLAGAVAFYGFLTLFPLLAIVGTVAAQLLSAETIARIDESLERGLVSLQWIVDNATSITYGAVLALGLCGLAWVDAVRGAVLGMWDARVEPAPTMRQKIVDVVLLVLVGLTMGVSIGITVAITAVLDWLIELIVVPTEISLLLTRVVGLAIAVAFATVLFVLLLAVLPGLALPWRATLGAAALAAVVYQGANVAITYYIASVARRSYYLSFGVPIALLVYLYVVARVLMAAAAWMVEGMPAGATEAQALRVAGGATWQLLGRRGWQTMKERLGPGSPTGR
jgi:membrane protein